MMDVYCGGPKTGCPMPVAVKVGPLVYSVAQNSRRLADHRSSGGVDVDGFCEHGLEEIVVSPDLGPMKKRSTLWHEVKHAVASCTIRGLCTTATEEEWISFTATMELAVLRDNPELVAYLTGEDE